MKSDTTKKTTLADVAREAGVSRGAACAALNGGSSGTTSVGAALQKHVRDAAHKLGYAPNSAARSLRSSKTLQIGVILPNTKAHDFLSSPQSFETIMGINTALEDGGYVLTLARLDDIVNEQDPGSSNMSLLFREQMIDVAIAVGQFTEESASFISKKFGKVIWCDGRVWDKNCCVRRDEAAAGALAVRKIAESGHRKFYVLSDDAFPSKSHFSFGLRYFGVVGECARQFVTYEQMTWKKFVSLPSAKLRGKVFLALAFDWAQRTYIHLAQKGMKLGGDVSLVSCDDYHQQWWCFQDISRVDFNRADMGRVAAQMALDYARTGEKPKSALIMSGWIDVTPRGTIAKA